MSVVGRTGTENQTLRWVRVMDYLTDPTLVLRSHRSEVSLWGKTYGLEIQNRCLWWRSLELVTPQDVPEVQFLHLPACSGPKYYCPRPVRAPL